MSTITTSTILKALADDRRLAIVRCLAKQERPAASCDVVRSCPKFAELSQPAMSHHFKKLVDGGVVIAKKSGTENMYLLDRERLVSVGIDAAKL
jgi:DNA-binding transcriptional ArsR family regulator